jgi:hypothetical protein
MFEKQIKNKLLPKNPEGWAKYNDKLIDDVSVNNLIDLATRFLVSFLFNSKPKNRLETTLIHELSEHTDDIAELMVIVFKTAKMYGSCTHDKYLLEGLYSFGVSQSIMMRYTPADYFYDDKQNMLILDVDGKLKKRYKKQVHNQIVKIINEQIPEEKPINSTTDKVDENAEADRLIAEWEKKNRGKNDVSN